MRWAMGLAVGAPLVLAAAFLVLKLGGNGDLARTMLRGLRYLIAAEFTILLVFALVGFNYERRARKQENTALHPPGKLVDIGGYRLHLFCSGRGGPTVVLEHGHRATYLDWFRVQSQIENFTRVCSYDRPGYGWSEPSPRDRIPSVMAEELRSALQAAGEKSPYIFVGHSFGAMNAIMFAHKFPDEVAGIVLVDGSHPESLKQISWRGKLWLRMMQITMPFGLPRWRGWCGGGPPEIAGEKTALTCRSEFFATILREDSSFPRSCAEIAGIANLGSVPLVVITRDPATGRNSKAEARNSELQRENGKLSTNSRFIVAEGSGHDVPLARPDVVIEAARNLLKPQAQADSRGTP